MPMLDLNIVGMTCGCCTGRVKHVLEALPDVHGVHVDLRMGRATVAVESDTNPQDLISAIKSAGFNCSP